MSWPLFTPQEDSWYSFMSEAQWITEIIVRLEGLGELKKSTSSRLEPAIFQWWYSSTILDFALDEDEWLASRPR
jgi:hypothetical protein